MTPEAKQALAKTIRALRARLLEDLHAATESAYRLSVRVQDAGLDEAGRARRARLERWIEEQRRTQGIAAQAAVDAQATEAGAAAGPATGLGALAALDVPASMSAPAAKAAAAAKGRPAAKKSRKTAKPAGKKASRAAKGRGGAAAAAARGRTADDFRREAEKQAAYTLLNRLVMLRLLEAAGLRAPAVVTGGWESRGYADFRALAPALVRGDATEGYAYLLQLVFEDLATDLPGLFGPAGVADLVPVPPATLRHVVEALDAEDLASCWQDDMTLGWVYQYWNDPEREALDAKLHAGGKVERHEIASKTQMFTERYMVDWLLQNSLGPLWLAVCKKHGWTPAVESDGTLARLEARRVEWRAKRDNKEVALTALMPLETEAEQRWAYYLPQPIPDDAIAHAPDTIRDVKILDPAVGSGHFVVVAFDLLLALYREEAHHRDEAAHPRWSDRAIVEAILERNLHGIDLDPRAVQIAAAALWLKAQQACRDARPRTLHLVASNLRLAGLPDDDPALVELRREVERETGIPAALTDTIVHALRGADHLGSLLKVDAAVEDAIRQQEALGPARPRQGDFWEGFGPKERDLLSTAEARATLLDRLERFLAYHTAGDDLGLRLRGEQLAAGVRFVRLVREGRYDLVVANPPYQGTAKMADARYVEDAYPLGKADVFAAFLLRGLELVRAGGASAMLTMRNWMFITQYARFRAHVLGHHTLRAVGDVSWGAFREMRDNPVAMSVVQRGPSSCGSVAVAPTDPQERVRTQEEFAKKGAGLLCHVGHHAFNPAALRVVPEWPLVYWWNEETLKAYQSAPLIGTVSPARQGLSTANNGRFLRRPWEVGRGSGQRLCWRPFVLGAEGRTWMEPIHDLISWRDSGLEMQASLGAVVRNSAHYFRRGIAFSMIGAAFTARAHRAASVFGDKGSSVFPTDLATTLCSMNTTRARAVLQSLNPSISFQVGDVNRLPLFPVENADDIYATLDAAFTEHESHREPSVEYKRPGPSPWRHAQAWAQTAVDRPAGAPLPPYAPVHDPEPPTDHVSFALGVALGRFGANGGGILDPTKDDLSHALPAGICFLDGTLERGDGADSLGHAAAAPLYAAWAAHGGAIDARKDLRTWLREGFFKLHKGMYENRPIHWPLSSAGKTFVAWVTIHRFNEQTLRVLLADHLEPARKRLDGEIADLRAARDGADKKAASAAEGRLEKVKRWNEELAAFIAFVENCADEGPPPPEPGTPPRERKARYAPDLDDGVMVNSAALWPLLDPQWKDPKTWWKELALPKGRKDYDWSHLAMRYWPTRVDAKCQQDPSLAVAHGCFWRYHPARAWAWELRLQQEIGPAFRIDEAPYRPGAGALAADAARGRGSSNDEAAFRPGASRPGDLGALDDPGSDAHRAAYLRDHPEEALAAVEKEAIRRMGRSKKRTLISSIAILEPGLWSSIPHLVWDLELRLSDRQGQEVRLLSPDEPSSRSAFESSHPALVQSRRDRLASLRPPTLFDEDVPPSESDAEPEEGNCADDEL